MISKRFRPMLLALVIVLLAAACGGSSDAETSSDAGNDAAQAAEAASDEADETASNEADEEAASESSVPEPETGGDPVTDATDAEATDAEDAPLPTVVPAPTEEVDPITQAINFPRALFNLDPSPEAIACITAQAEADPLFGEAMAMPNPVITSFSDDMLYAVTTGMNGCVDSIGLGGWAMEAVGPTGDVRLTAPSCFAESFDDPEDGDELFHIFVALSFQFRYDPDYAPGIIDTLSTCTPLTGLVPVFASQAEQRSGFATEIDLDCFGEALSDPQVSIDFWTALVDGFEPPTNVVDPLAADCERALYEGLFQAVPEDFEAWSAKGSLAEVAPPARANAYSEQPPLTIDPEGSYTALFITGGGEIRIELFASSAPVTVNNFVNLARDGYYDGTVFHRVLDDFMAQGGDPTGTGGGGPGYSFEDETEGGPAMDRAGLLAMANSGPATNGSQFFITFAPADWLTGNHTIFGEVVAGQDIVDAIERRDPDFPQGRGQVLDRVTIIEG